MPLNAHQVGVLDAAVAAYAFPPEYFDFVAGVPVIAPTVALLEVAIGRQLTSANLGNVEHGLANVIYWGNATAGYRNHRVAEFRTHITQVQLTAFQALVTGGRVPTLREIKRLEMRGYSGISFVSKVLMFLNPAQYCVLDLQLTALSTPGGHGALNHITFTTQIPITARNMAAYDSWRVECIRISNTYYGGRYRAVDIERGFFHLIQSGRLLIAQQIYEDA